MGLSAARSFAQQRQLPRQADSAKVIRLRQQWFYRQRAYPHKHIPAGARFKAYQQLRKTQAAQRSRRQKQQTTTSTTLPSTSTTFATALSSTSWTPIGPQPTTTPYAFNPVSGRVTALAVDPTNSNIVYLGGAEGGVWKTTDGGSTWTPLTDNQPSLAVGSIAIDPENPQTIYVGTGEENFNLDAYFGAGILKSTDGGATWAAIGTGPQDGPYGAKPYFYGGYVGSIAVDPQNSQVLLAAVSEVSNLGGVWRSADGGQTWTQIGLGLPTQVFFDPTNGSVAYAAIAGNGVYKSTDAGESWTSDNGTGTNVLSVTNSFRISVALDPAHTSTLYASVTSNPSTSTGSTVLGFYKTTDGGANWTAIWTQTASTSSNFPSNYCSPAGEAGQCWYDNVVAVDPASSAVFVGGSFEATSTSESGALWRSNDGGSTWSDIDPPPSSSGVQALHPDLHAIAFAGGKMYVATDGGLWSTANVTTSPVTWTNLNTPLALTQFYPGVSVAAYDSNLSLGGTQDNGVQYYSGSLTWQMVGCGDGAQTAIDPSGSGDLYAGCIYIPDPSNQDFLFKFTPGSGWAPADNGINGDDYSSYIPPLTVDPSNPQTLYFATANMYQSKNGGQSWSLLGQSPPSAPSWYYTSVAVAPTDSNTVYAGWSTGYVYGTFNAGDGASAIWQIIGTGPSLPGRYITAVAADPHNAKKVYATFSGYCLSGTSTCPSGEGHVFECTGASGVWNDLSGNLPDVPVNDIAVDPDMPGSLYIGTDIGVFATTDDGTTWEPLGTGLPNVAVLSLKLQDATRILRAASHGRSAWDFQLPAPAGPNVVFSVPNLTFPPQQVGTTSPAQSVTITNNGTATLTITSIAASSNFAETNTCGSSLAPAANCTISVTFTPAALGTETGTVTLTDNAASGSTQTVGLSGKGFSGAVSLSPTSLSFGNQLVGTTSAAQTVTLTNSSTVPLTITSVASSSHFTATTDCPVQPSTLSGGASCHITVTFAPNAAGTYGEQITITDSAGDSPQILPVTGTGVQPVVTFNPSSLSFGTQVVGTTSTQTATLTNTGGADLTIDSLTPTANTAQDGLAIVDTSSAVSETDNCPRTPSTIPPNGSCTITVSITTTIWGSLSGSIEAIDNAWGGKQYLDVSETAYSGQATLSPTSLTFSSVPIGETSPPQAVTLTNTGSSPLYVAGIGGDGVFQETDNCPRPTASSTSLAAGASCTINVTFTAFQTGTVTGGIVLTDSSSGYDQQQIQASGTGMTGFTITPASGSSLTAIVTPGGSASYSLTVTPVKGFTQTVALGCSGAPSLATCTVSPASVTLDGTHSQNVKVTVTTTAASLAPPGPRGGPPPPGGFASHDGWFALLWLLMLGALALVFRRRKRRAPLLAGVVLLAALAVSCGGGGSSSGGGGTGTNPGTPTGTYTLTVTGNSGSLQSHATLQLTVQ